MEKKVSLYIDTPPWKDTIKVDDFIIAIGIKQSNSVYHVAEVRSKQSPKNSKFTRHYVKCYRSDLITALRRDSNQLLIPITWYKRTKKTPNLN